MNLKIYMPDSDIFFKTYLTEREKQSKLGSLQILHKRKLEELEKLKDVTKKIELATSEINEKIVQLEKTKKINDPEYEKKMQEFEDKIQSYEQYKEQYKREFELGEITFKQYKKCIEVNINSIKYVNWEKDKFLSLQQNVEYSAALQKLIDERFNLAKTFFPKIVSDDSDYSYYFSYLIQDAEKIIVSTEQEISTIKNMKTYPEDVVNKANILRIDLENPIDSNLLMENWREKYEVYAKEHNLFKEYTILLRLLEDYYDDKGHPFHKTAIYCQEYPHNMLTEIISDIQYDVMMKEECKILQMIKNKKLTIQKYLIEVCNKHKIEWLIFNSKMDLFCLKHPYCIINMVPEQNEFRCNFGTKYDCRLKTESVKYLSMLKLENFNLECTLYENNDIFSITECK